MEIIAYRKGLFSLFFLLMVASWPLSAAEISVDSLDMKCQLEALELGVYESPALNDYVLGCMERELPYFDLATGTPMTIDLLRFSCGVEAFHLGVKRQDLFTDYVNACVERELPYRVLLKQSNSLLAQMAAAAPA